MRQSGNRHGAGGPWHDLRREPAGMCGSQMRVLDVFKREEHLSVMCRRSELISGKKLEEIVAEYDCVIAHRGKGLIQDWNLIPMVGPVVSNALMEQHLVLISAGANIIRFVPPLVIEKADVDEMVVRLKAAIEVTVK